MQKILRKIITFLCNLLVVLIALNGIVQSGFAASQVIPNGNYNTFKKHVFTFNQLFSINNIVLKGINPASSIYLPLPKAWQIQSILLHLVISPSPILSNVSTLTIESNGIPISTLKLAAEKNSPFAWDILVPANLIKGGSIALKLIGYLRITDNICADMENPGNWVHITQNSTIEYLVNELNYQPKLSEFPYPFIRAQSPSPDFNTIVIPNPISFETLAPAFYVAGILGREATWRGMKLNSMSLEQFKKPAKQDTNFILVGTTQKLALSPKSLNANHSPIPENTGVLLLAQSPWNSKRAQLIITGENNTGITKAISALAYPLFPDKTDSENYTLVPLFYNIEQNQINWNHVSFKKLGYADQFVYGTGQLETHHNIPLPGETKIQKLNLTVQLGHAPFISSRSSYLMLSVNGIPQGGVNLDSTNESNATWQLTIPGKDLQPGDNDFNFMFDLRLSEEACTRYYLSRSWGAIYSNTRLQARFSDQLPRLILTQFPTLFAKSSLLVLPTNKAFYATPELPISLIHLGLRMKAHPQNIRVINAEQANEDLLKKHNVIFIGSLDDPMIKKILKSSPLSIDQNTITIQTPTQTISLPLNKSLGFIQLIASPWNAHKIIMLISGTDENSAIQALGVLVNKKTFASLNGNIVIISKDGILKVFDSQPVETELSSEMMEQFYQHQNLILIILLSLFAAMGLLTALVYILKRKKNRD